MLTWLDEGNTLPQVLPIVIRGNIIDVNLVTFLGNEGKADMHEVYLFQWSEVMYCVQTGSPAAEPPGTTRSETEILKKATATQDIQTPLTPEGKISER